MLPIKHILFPVDFSERCENAAPLVEGMAKRCGAKITLLATVQPLVYGGVIEPGAPLLIDTETLRAGVQGRLDRAFPEKFQGIEVARVSELGDAAQSIVEFAEQNDVHLIMLPTHGYGPFRRLLLGSVTAKVLHDAHCPVWTEAHMEAPEIEAHLKTSVVICAVDRSEQTVRVMNWAADFARAMGASLRLVHAVPAVEAWPERQLDREFEETMRAESRNFLTSLQKSAGVEAPLCVEAGDVAKVVHEETRRHGADLIVIGRGSVHGVGRLRAHSHAIIREAHCPVISV